MLKNVSVLNLIKFVIKIQKKKKKLDKCHTCNII